MSQPSPTRGAKRTERLEARVSPELKALLQQAAELEGLSVTDFLVASVARSARATVRRHHLIQLSARDSVAFAEAVLNPGAPNPALQAAFDRVGAAGTN